MTVSQTPRSEATQCPGMAASQQTHTSERFVGKRESHPSQAFLFKKILSSNFLGAYYYETVYTVYIPLILSNLLLKEVKN